jgi:phosphoglycolate phosphatase
VARTSARPATTSSRAATVASASDYRDRVSDLSGVLVLWDIDGTLVTHAPSPRDRHAHAVSTVLGRKVEPISAGIGKTDRQIMVELFADHLPSESEIEQAFEVIDALTEEDMVTAPSTAVDGVDAALGALSEAGAGHTVLTGNSPRRAELAQHIDFDSGFYGHIHSTRMELVADAAQRLSLQQGVRPVIIGDTPLDILAAQASGIPVIAVATGIYSLDELAQHKPSAVVGNYDDADALIGLVADVYVD